MKIAIFFGTVALAYFCNAFIFVNNGHYPVYDAMLRETEKAVEHLKKLAEGMRGNQTSVEDLIQKLEKNKTETSKKIDEALQMLAEAEKNNKDSNCTKSLKSLKEEGEKIKNELVDCYDKKGEKAKNLKGSDSGVNKTLEKLMKFEKSIENCKKQVKNVVSAMCGFWCLKPIKINAIFERKAFAQTKNKTTENMKLVEEVKNSDPKCDSENVDRFVKRSEEENKKVSECAKEEKENKSKSKNPEPSDVSTTDANDTVVRKSASG